jgi:hypothetical protein
MKANVPPLVLTRSGVPGRAITLLSACDPGSPLSCIRSICRTLEAVKTKSRNQVFRKTWFLLSHPALPFFLELQFLRAGTRVQGEEIDQQAVELLSLLHHWEVTRTIQDDVVHHLRDR